MYELKIDPSLPYHYFISVGIRTMMSHEPGKLFLKHGPLKFINDDVKKVQDAAMITTDKLFPTTNKEAVTMFGVGELTNSVWSMFMAAAANNCTVHHFSSDIELPDDFWDGFVTRANTNEHERSKLLSATIRSRGFI